MSASLLLLFQILAHASLLCAAMTFSPNDWAVALAVYAVCGCFGITVTYHRLLAHSAWKAPTWARRLGTLVGVYGMAGSPIAWAALHRQHHFYADTPKDPLSPQFVPWWKVQWMAMLHPAPTALADDLLRDRFTRWLHQSYEAIHLVVLVVLLWGVGLHTTMVWYLTPAAILWNATAAINTFGHGWTRGSSSRNIWPLGLLVFGEGYHRNHHLSPTSPRFSRKWWQLDLGWGLIRLLRTRPKTERQLA